MTDEIKPFYTRVLIRDGLGNVLVVVHKDRKVALPGGKLDPGETAEQAAVREVYEETGLELNGVRQVLVNEYQFDDKKHLAVFFEAERYIGIPRNREPEKIAYVGWVSENFLLASQHERVTDTLLAARRLRG